MPESGNLIFTVRRRSPQLISPAEPTPRESKPLSDLDDQRELRFQTPVIQFYRRDSRMAGKNPASVIREGLAKVLVIYYPLAGRLRELGPAGKLVVDCTGEGVVFTEAEAGVRIEQFGEALLPPFPCVEELLPAAGGILNSPLLVIQVTRLLCGGFIFAMQINHTLCDGPGMLQFMRALGEMSRGASTPSVPHVWERELLLARNPPRVTRTHHEYNEVVTTTISSHDDMIYKSFFFGPTELSILRNSVSLSCSTFELITACIWRCRTFALQPNPEDQMRIMLAVNARAKFNPRIPLGYYGNCVGFPVVLSTAREILSEPLQHIIGLVSKAKSCVTEEYMRSFIDLTVIEGRPHFAYTNTFFIVDFTHTRFNEVDFGWGNAAYGGAAKLDLFAGNAHFLIPFMNERGESRIVIPICLPKPSMERFEKELDKMLMKDINHDQLLTSKF